MAWEESAMRSILFAAIVSCSTGTAAAGETTALPDESLNLRLAAPIESWDEALPLGNGLMGGLLWGANRTIRLSLDRGDLWDERPAEGMQWDQFTYANLKKWVAARDEKSIDTYLDRAYRDAHPTKIPAGRLEITLGAQKAVARFELNLAAAAPRRCGADMKRCAKRTRLGGRRSGADPPSAFHPPTRTSCGSTTSSGTSTAPPRAAERRPCRCKACGRPTPAGCLPGRATTTTISTRR
jgi:hypothetical protein